MSAAGVIACHDITVRMVGDAAGCRTTDTSRRRSLQWDRAHLTTDGSAYLAGEGLADIVVKLLDAPGPADQAITRPVLESD